MPFDGTKLRDERKDAGMSRRALSEQLKLYYGACAPSESSIEGHELGRGNPRWSTAETYAAFFGMPMDYWRTT